ncbi:ABC transporter related protein [Paenibacillus curdlanolyticus YK9]|uniref:ABC transporter related protein n=1 Tax=Paenibacillus curdlanolyticus YK9 TaxID=717606 RepID=E0I4Y9_9BACL|nr:ABC transporter ATP-binding protein [Paenibacillus curdlanolyticus]EFM12031.1 ABC transporter related protein [Paenibacillus curdlanolyticus YK9]
MIITQYWKEFVRVMAYMKPRAWDYGIGIVGNNAIAAIGLNILMAFMYKDIVNAAVQGDGAMLIRSVASAVGILAVSSFACTFLTYRYNTCIRYTMTDIRQQAFRHVEKLPLSRFEKTHSGELLSRLTNDLNTVEHLYADSLGGLVYAVVVGVGAMIAMFALNVPIALFAIGLGIVTFLLNTAFAGSFRRINDDIQRGAGKMTQALSDVLAGMPIVKMFALDRIIIRKYDDTNANVANLSIKRVRKYAVLDIVNSIMGSLSFVGIVIIGGVMALNKGTDFGTVMAFVKLQGNIGFLFMQAGNLMNDVQRVLSGASRVFELLDTDTEQESHSERLPENGLYAIELNNMRFEYAAGLPVLNGLNLQIRSGQTVALVGPSGSGKSTIAKLLLGLYPSAEGSVRYWGRDASVYSLTQIREMIAYVPQDAYLFDGTIEENIGYGNLVKDKNKRDRIMGAAAAANAHAFISKEPDGYATEIGEAGARLSGGQKQRVSIARALLADAPILLMDEPTSALDADSERQIEEALRELRETRKEQTVIIIAHRLSTIEHADRIFVMEHGQVIEEGDHNELMQQRGLYEQLYRLQCQAAAG